MSAPKFTPGPWQTDLNNMHAAQIATVPNCVGGWVEIRSPEAFNASEETQEANARLIAAAPELLDALIAAEKALNNIRVCCQHTAWDSTGPAVIAARAAIARATGEAQ